ncbi:hypothetical protein J3F84DRAFT_30119 [Trichoderma pleuroticola]
MQMQSPPHWARSITRHTLVNFSNHSHQPPALTDNMAKCHSFPIQSPFLQLTSPRRLPRVLTASSCFTWALQLPLNGMMPATMQCSMTMPRFNALSLSLIQHGHHQQLHT